MTPATPSAINTMLDLMVRNSETSRKSYGGVCRLNIIDRTESEAESCP